MFWIGIIIGLVVGALVAAFVIAHFLLMPQMKTMTVVKDGLVELATTMRKTRLSDSRPSTLDH